MKRPLITDDYIRMVWDGVYDKYPPDHPQYELYATLTSNDFDSLRRYGYPEPPKDLAYRKHLLYQAFQIGSNGFYRGLMQMIANEPKTYRVSLNDKGGVEVVCFDLENVDSELEGYYDGISELPTWVQERIAVLSVCNPNPPTPTVDGIGRRISENVYWVYK